MLDSIPVIPGRKWPFVFKTIPHLTVLRNNKQQEPSKYQGSNKNVYFLAFLAEGNGSGQQVSCLVPWVKPSKGWSKLKVDGSSIGNRGLASACRVIRYESGIGGTDVELWLQALMEESDSEETGYRLRMPSKTLRGNSIHASSFKFTLQLLQQQQIMRNSFLFAIVR
ncbi:unnamed protein product [Dovyalis caffra]|uniref:Uncharacterized protein n=1 Tax=Dovyalis caffra TaxID=77055 RepID=A0AAV1SLY8_9ROSI|nr:unnamed protein product [Dovyalis caffra]